MDQFKSGLNQNVENLMINFNYSSALEELITLAVRCNQRIFQHQVERQIEVPQNGVPMDLDATQAQPTRRLDPAERQRRFENRLCWSVAATSI